MEFDWITGIRNAVEYIEENITEPLDYAEIAKQSFSSYLHQSEIITLAVSYSGSGIDCQISSVTNGINGWSSFNTPVMMNTSTF